MRADTHSLFVLLTEQAPCQLHEVHLLCMCTPPSFKHVSTCFLNLIFVDFGTSVAFSLKFLIWEKIFVQLFLNLGYQSITHGVMKNLIPPSQAIVFAWL